MNKIQDSVSKWFHAGEVVVIGVSGGADSMALLHAVCHCGVPLQIMVAHVNHCLRGEESDRDENFVRQYCEKQQILFYSKRVDVASLAEENRQSEEVCGREQRYAFFEELAGKDGWILTAHTLSDRIETMLFHLTRGSSLSGLCSIPQKRGKILRPLLDFTRQEIEAYCQEFYLPYVQDSTNDLDLYNRNKIRHHVVPVLQEINPRFAQNMLRTFQLLEADRELLQKQAEHQFYLLFDKGKLWVERMIGVPTAISSRIISLFLEQHQIPADTKLILSILQICQRGFGKYNVPGNRFVVCQNGWLSVQTPVEGHPYFEYQVENCTNCRVSGFHLLVGGQEIYEQFINVAKNFFHSIVDYDKIFGKVKIRQRMPGDRISLPNHPNRKVKKYWNEQKIPLEQRDLLAVFEDDNGVFAVEGLGIDQRVQPDAHTTRYLWIQKETV